jgi:hypothetical protein
MKKQCTAERKVKGLILSVRTNIKHVENIAGKRSPFLCSAAKYYPALSKLAAERTP